MLPVWKSDFPPTIYCNLQFFAGYSGIVDKYDLR